MVRDPHRQSTDDHVGIAYGLHLVHVVGVDGGVEARVQVVEEVHDLEGSGVGRNRREADYVGEVYRYFFEFLGVDGHAQLELLGDGAGRKGKWVGRICAVKKF